MAQPNTPQYRIVNLDRACELVSSVEIAATSAARRKGLLRRTQVENTSGLWLAPCEAVHTFGMKVPIDVVFLDRHYRAKKLVRNLPPSRISVCLAGSSVLELASGSIERTGLKCGDRLQFQALRKAA